MAIVVGPALSRIMANPAVPMLILWFVGAALTIFIPLIKWNKNRKQWYKWYGVYVEYEQNQRQYEENQNGNNNNNNNNYYMPSCKWWQFRCKRQARLYQQYQNRDGNRDDQIITPGWYQFLGGTTEEDQREREENGGGAGTATGAIRFVYSWSLIMFLALILYGAVVIAKRRNPAVLIVALAVFAQCALLMLVLLPQGVIDTDGRQVEESVYGWNGQLSVLMVYTDFAYILFTVIFSILFCVYAFILRRMEQNQNNAAAASTSPSKNNAEGGNYNALV